MFALLVSSAGFPRPALNSWSLPFGHTLPYFAASIAISFGVGQLADMLEKLQSIDYGIGGLVGMLLIGVSALAALDDRSAA